VLPHRIIHLLALFQQFGLRTVEVARVPHHDGIDHQTEG
jgi:hypothetical protein